jgi:hypothetical protein
VVTFRAELGSPLAPGSLLEWESDRDGVLAVTGSLVFSRDASSLSRGVHTITLLVQDDTGLRTACGSATLLVAAAPIIRLVPLAGGSGTHNFDDDENHVQMELYRVRILSDFLESIRIENLVCRPLPGTTLGGVTRPRLYYDWNGNGRAESEESIAEGVNDGHTIRFSGLNLVVKTNEQALLLGSRVNRDVFLGGTMSLRSILPLILFAGLASLVGGVRRGRRGAALGALVLLAAFLAPEAGCRKERSNTIQLTLKTAGDFEATALDSGLRVEIDNFPPDGLPGPRIRVKERSAQYYDSNL